MGHMWPQIGSVKPSNQETQPYPFRLLDNVFLIKYYIYA